MPAAQRLKVGEEIHKRLAPMLAEKAAREGPAGVQGGAQEILQIMLGVSPQLRRLVLLLVGMALVVLKGAVGSPRSGIGVVRSASGCVPGPAGCGTAAGC